MEKKILIAVDDSENARRAVEFVASVFKPDHKVTLFSVALNTTAICDLNSPGLTPYFVSQQSAFCQVEDQQKALMQKALEAAKETLLSAGFKADHVRTRLETEKKGLPGPFWRRLRKDMTWSSWDGKVSAASRNFSWEAYPKRSFIRPGRCPSFSLTD
ncbi:MAG: universal stress protein [Deltaproteobacteria bacterium]|nr:universal stress protein [Deltaproteobacteria bacterium]